jgi:hypothetical protein
MKPSYLSFVALFYRDFAQAAITAGPGIFASFRLLANRVRFLPQVWLFTTRNG